MKILLVEDDRVFAARLIGELQNYLFTVDLAEDGETGFVLGNSAEYDLIVLEGILPKIDGINLCRRLRQLKCNTPIILLMARDSNIDIIEGLNVGADDYVIKPFDLQVFLARINALLRRNQTEIVSILTWGNLCLNPIYREVTCGENKIDLTPNEYKILELFLRNPQRMWSRSQIINRVWSFDKPPTEKAVNTHIKNLRYKLKQGGIIDDPIETLRSAGYRLKALSSDISTDENY